MARAMKATGDAYRAVIRETSSRTEEGGLVTYRTFTRFEGPYATAAAAKSRITWAERMVQNRPNVALTAYVEKAPAVWERVQ